MELSTYILLMIMIFVMSGAVGGLVMSGTGNAQVAIAAGSTIAFIGVIVVAMTNFIINAINGK